MGSTADFYPLRNRGVIYKTFIIQRGKKMSNILYGKTVLRWASEYGHSEIVKILLSAGANVHADNDWDLYLASGNGHSEVVKILLKAGADVHANKDGALQWASGNGHSEVVKVLLSEGADVYFHLPIVKHSHY